MSIRTSGDSLHSLLLEIQKKYDEKDNSVDILCIYSKSALMEFSGWIEECNDALINNYISTKLNDYFTKQINSKISAVYGFKYLKFEQLFVLAIGYVNFQKITNEPDINIDFERFKSILNNLGKTRDDAAHTHRTLPQYLNAPNSHVSNLQFLIAMFLRFETSLSRLE